MHIPPLDRQPRRDFAGVVPRLKKFSTKTARSEKNTTLFGTGNFGLALWRRH
jgi:hypothetical protein